jgi:hypothetical protein
MLYLSSCLFRVLCLRHDVLYTTCTTPKMGIICRWTSKRLLSHIPEFKSVFPLLQYNLAAWSSFAFTYILLRVAYVTRQINSRRSLIWRICLLNAHFSISEHSYYHFQYHNYCFRYSHSHTEDWLLFRYKLNCSRQILELNSAWSKSKSHCDWRSVSQSVSQSWCRAQSGAYDQIFQSRSHIATDGQSVSQ